MFHRQWRVLSILQMSWSCLKAISLHSPLSTPLQGQIVSSRLHLRSRCLWYLRSLWSSIRCVIDLPLHKSWLIPKSSWWSSTRRDSPSTPFQSSYSSLLESIPLYSKSTNDCYLPGNERLAMDTLGGARMIYSIRLHDEQLLENVSKTMLSFNQWFSSTSLCLCTNLSHPG